MIQGIRNIIRKYGKVVFGDNEYKITFDDKVCNGAHIILLHEDRMQGLLNVGDVEIDGEMYYLVRGIMIRSKHRNKGYGTEMYKALIDNHDPEYKGIASYLKRRVNTDEIPNIYSKFNSETLDEYVIINFENV